MGARGCSLLVLLACLLRGGSGWQQWNYTSHTTDAWKKLWGLDEGPGGRRGHSMVLYGTQIIMFGGRDRELQRNHQPMTYRLRNENGTLVIRDDEYEIPISECVVDSGTNSSGDDDYAAGDDDYFTDDDGSSGNSTTNSNSTTTSSSTACLNMIDVGLYYNDVWSYELNCTRFADTECQDESWEVRHEGAWEGGCKNVMGREICEVPGARWLHGAAMFDDETMLIYGGFSQKCADYCDDLWSFDLRDNTWMEIYEIGFFNDGASPGKRWKFSIVANGHSMLIFGGFRLWHGFADDNSIDNRWESYDIYPKGGYLQDLWNFTKKMLEPWQQVPTENFGYGEWYELTPVEECYPDPGVTWDARFETSCSTTWPGSRAGHVSVLDSDRQLMWIHGGFTSYFPYVSTDGTGAGYGIQNEPEADGFTPYPRYPFFLDDLWYFNLSSGLWTEVTPLSASNPGPRVDHVMIIAGNMLFIFGGFFHNHNNDETWLYNISSNRWLLKEVAVHPLYPEDCTDDWEYILDEANNCTLLYYPKPIERSDTHGNNYKIFEDWDKDKWWRQPYYSPNENDTYFGIIDKGAEVPLLRSELAPPGTPMVPFAATGPRQYVRKIEQVNGTINGTVLHGVVYERCTSVKGEVTRDKLTDGQFGRLDHTLFIDQPRRQNPGWDGCRDRYDGNPDLEAKLMYKHPSQRSQHTAIYISTLPVPEENHASADKQGELYLFGGIGHEVEQPETTDTTHAMVVQYDFWRMGIHECVNNCSNNGVCDYGFCECFDGYYGVDCSNQSCPGDFCYYDEYSREQICTHCCAAGYHHQDGDDWLSGLGARKVTCNHDEYETPNGICDGYGTCQCAPPFLGNDCSVKDCKDNCSFNGYCSVEYPVSRCICNPGYFGETCDQIQCLNNCSYPNGICNYSTGLCECHLLRNPYNSSRTFHIKKVADSDRRRGEWADVTWSGEDCSWLMAYAGAASCRPPTWLAPLLLLASAVVGWQVVQWK